MTKRFKFKISRILSFKSCRSKDPSSLPFNPDRPFLQQQTQPQLNPTANAIAPTVSQRRHRSSSFKQQVLIAFGCGSIRRRHSSTPEISPSPSPPPPKTPKFRWESEGNWHVIETHRRKIYDGENEGRRSVKKKRREEKYKTSGGELSETESLIPSSTCISPVNSTSDLPRGIKRRNHCSVKRKSNSSTVDDESELSSSSPPRLSLFTESCAGAAAVAVVKRSEDPYQDFKRSMVEMIIEKRMVEVAELEKLLRCFLTLNSKRHHNAIVRAFSEVWVDLFCGDSDSNRAARRSSSVRLSDYEF